MSKKFFKWSFFSLLLIGLVSFSVVSCGDDDDDTTSGNGADDGGDASVLPGVWSYQFWDDEDKIEVLLTFFEGGTGIYAEVETEEDGEMDSDGSTFTYQMTSANNGIITLDYGNSSYYSSYNNKESYQFEFKNGKITIHGLNSDYYYYYGSSTTSVFNKISNLGNNASLEGSWKINDRIMEFQSGGRGIIKSTRKSEEETFTYNSINETEGIIEIQESNYYYSGSSKGYYKYKIVGARMYLFDDAPWVDLDYMLIKQ